jgi:hypothetical protein
MTKEKNDERKMSLIIKRVMDIQRRSKIKPSAMNPILLNHPNMQKGVQFNK